MKSGHEEHAHEDEMQHGPKEQRVNEVAVHGVEAKVIADRLSNAPNAVAMPEVAPDYPTISVPHSGEIPRIDVLPRAVDPVRHPSLHVEGEALGARANTGGFNNHAWTCQPVVVRAAEEDKVDVEVMEHEMLHQTTEASRSTAVWCLAQCAPPPSPQGAGAANVYDVGLV